MKDYLEKLNFKNIDQQGFTAYSKVYKGFILFIACGSNKIWVASITIGRLEISIPGEISQEWIEEFEFDNIEHNPS